LANYLDGCTQLGEADGLNVVDCGLSSNIHHGFIGDDSKTDNFKVKSTSPEIDTVFKNAATGAPLDGRGVTWFDTNGASNQKWSYYAPALQVNHEAHVEGVEVGTHKIKIANQPGCTVDSVKVDGVVTDGPQTVSVKVKNARKDTTFFIYVYCG
jgi:hypothetical protein